MIIRLILLLDVLDLMLWELVALIKHLNVMLQSIFVLVYYLMLLITMNIWLHRLKIVLHLILLQMVILDDKRRCLTNDVTSYLH